MAQPDRPTPPSSRWRGVSTWALLVLLYLGLAVVLTWPLVFHLDSALLGTATTDQVDTAWLRLAVARTLVGMEAGVFSPLGYEIGAVVPNWVDHLTGAPLALLLPWPLADNTWWILALAANGLAAHALGHGLTGRHGAGLICGVGLAASEPVLREAALSHAPQVLVCWAPLFLLFGVRALSGEGRLRQAALAGLFWGLSALTYWYQGLFLAVLALPVVVEALVRAHGEGRLRPSLLRLGLALGVGLALCAVPLALFLHGGTEAAGVGLQRLPPAVERLGVPPEHAWAFLHGQGPAWPLLSSPAHRSSRLSLVLVAAAGLGAWRSQGPRWPWLVAAVLGGLLLMGPYLQVRGQPVVVAGQLLPLPGWLLAESSDLLARLHWPQRWAIVVPLALLPLAARVPRPSILAGLLLVETLLFSANAPLPTSTMTPLAGWEALDQVEGTVLVLPQELRGDGPSVMGLVYRASGGAPLANEVGLPPWAPQPLDFREWKEARPLATWWRWSRRDEALPPSRATSVADLREQGIHAVALEATPGGPLTPEHQEALAARLSQTLGPPQDLGCLFLWWVVEPEERPPSWEDGPAWRRRMAEELASHGGRRVRPGP